MSHLHMQKKILLQPLAVMCTWQSQDACALDRHCEPCKQSSWSQARNSQENRPFLTASGVGTRSPTWTIAVSWEKALNLHPSKCQIPNHSWVDWWEADGKLPELVGLKLRDLRPQSPWHNHYTTQPPHLHQPCIHHAPAMVPTRATLRKCWVMILWIQDDHGGLLHVSCNT